MNWGHTIPGTRESQFSNATYLCGGAITTGGVLTDINLFCAGWGGATTCRIGIYAVNAASPSAANLIADTGEMSFNGTTMPATYAKRNVTSIAGVTLGQTIPSGTHLYIVIKSNNDFGVGGSSSGPGDLTDLSSQGQLVNALSGIGHDTAVAFPSTFPTYTSSGAIEQLMVQLVMSASVTGTVSGVTDAESVPTVGATGGNHTVTITLKTGPTTPLASTTRRFWTRTSVDAAATDGGSAGLAVTSDVNGVFVINGLTISPGAQWLTYKDPSDNLNCHTVPVTIS